MKNVILKTYKTMSQSLLHVFAATVQQTMSDDALFTSLKADIDALEVENTAYGVALGKLNRGGEPEMNAKNDCYAAVIARLDVLAHGVTGLAKGDVRVARAAAFDTPKERRSINEILMPTGLKATNIDDHTGWANVKWDRNTDITNTGIEFQKKGETDWKQGPFITGSSTILTGLEAGAYHYVRIYFTGRKGLQSDKTEPVMVLVS